ITNVQRRSGRVFQGVKPAIRRIDKSFSCPNPLSFGISLIYSQCQIMGFPDSSIDKKSQRPIFCRQFCDNTRLLAHL
ncbi:unnamed protein product, partial [Chrysoparadoxa australica]